jgi:hypothetical protein
LAFELYLSGQTLRSTPGVNELIAQQAEARWMPFSINGVLFLVLALTWFERRWFYQIIDRAEHGSKS